MLMNDVVIVGAGPVGLFAALLLEQRGMTVALYERWPAFYPRPRACGVDHEIIRQLQDAGLAEELAPLLDPVIGPDKTYEFLNGAGETILKIDWNREGASGWAQMNMFYQPDVEQLLARRIEASPRVTIHRGRELLALEQHDDHVSLEFGATGDASDKVTAKARYVLGADGARSTTRELLGIGQTDLGFQYDWLVVDVIPNEERVWKPYVVQHCDPARPSTLVASGPGRRRWEFMCLPGESIDELNTTEKAWELLAPWNITPDNAKVERHAVYTFRGSWADQWQKDRVFLAGDAAHLMPPFLGQGLCSGMRDALAFCWRMEAVLRGDATPDLFTSYGPERSEHVQEIIRQAVEMGRLICMLDPAEVAARDASMKEAMRDPSLALKPPPEPRLGTSLAFIATDPNAGYLSVQGRVRYGGREGLFDDVVGKGWQLLLRSEGPTPLLTPWVQEAVRRLGGVVADFGPQGDTVDIDGTYGTWFERLGVRAVLVRPDFYVFGTAPMAELKTLLTAAEKLLGTDAERPSPVVVAAQQQQRAALLRP
jgi:2-polyprenyl-6-methoxyphenol hydroxylase-like FAD-dependent oxidoreductase